MHRCTDLPINKFAHGIDTRTHGCRPEDTQTFCGRD